MPIDDEVRQRLGAVVADVRLPIDDRCRAQLDALVEVGVQGDAADEARMVVAESHLRRPLDDMTQQTRILKFDALHEPMLASAMERNGPLWPFC